MPPQAHAENARALVHVRMTTDKYLVGVVKACTCIFMETQDVIYTPLYAAHAMERASCTDTRTSGASWDKALKSVRGTGASVRKSEGMRLASCPIAEYVNPRSSTAAL
jgi:hypothetical protein